MHYNKEVIERLKNYGFRTKGTIFGMDAWMHVPVLTNVIKENIHSLKTELEKRDDVAYIEVDPKTGNQTMMDGKKVHLILLHISLETSEESNNTEDNISADKIRGYKMPDIGDKENGK